MDKDRAELIVRAIDTLIIFRINRAVAEMLDNAKSAGRNAEAVQEAKQILLESFVSKEL